MNTENRYDGIDSYAVALIKRKAKQLVGHVGLTESDRHDLEQDMILDLIRRLSKYNPNRAPRQVFIARIVEHKVAAIIKARKAAKRDYRCCNCSINEWVENDDQGGQSAVRLLI